MKRTLQERLDLMMQLRREGYNCGQSVILVFDDVTGLDPDLAARLTSGLGSGCGASGELCGAVNAMAITQGILQNADPAAKGVSAKCAGQLMKEFALQNGGRLRCADLKSKEGIRPCNGLIANCIELLHNHFAELDAEK